MHLLSRINRSAPVCLHRSIPVYKPAVVPLPFFLSLSLSLSRSVTMVSNVPGRKIRHSVYTYNMHIFAGRRKRFPLEGGNTLNNAWDIFHSFYLYFSWKFVSQRWDQISYFVPVPLNLASWVFECLFKQDMAKSNYIEKIELYIYRIKSNSSCW